jgi:hypothetical protein
MNRAEFEQDLQGFFHNEAEKVKHPEGWWDNVVSRATGEKPVYTAPKVGFFRRKLFVVPLAVILALMVTGGTVYAYSSYFEDLIERMIPSVENEETGEIISMARQYDLSQTRNGVTVKLEYAYADMNQIRVGGSVDGAEDYDIFLRTEDGGKLYSTMGHGDASGDRIWSFHTPSMHGDPSSLNLRMVISVSEDTEPFIFDFEAPYYGGKVVNVGQTVEAAGVKIKLESLLISPSETQVIFQYSELPEVQGGYASPASINILLPDGTLTYDDLSMTSPKTATHYIYGNFIDQHGEWVITITELMSSPSSMGDKTVLTDDDCIHIPGPWVFTVQVK